MSDLKFTCPSCGQHLSVDSTLSGRTVNCPTCQHQVTVPASAGGPPPVPPPAARAAAYPPTPLPIPGPRGANRTCRLAIASLICSIGSFIIIPLGFIPGIICGHLARKKFRQDPHLGGAGLAKAGLIVGYVSLGVHVLVIVAVGVFALTFGRQMVEAARQQAQAQQQNERARRQIVPPPVAVEPGEPTRQSAPPSVMQRSEGGEEKLDTTPDGSGWTLKLADAAFPSGPVSGRIHGKPFQCEKVQIQGGWLKFRQGSDFFADLEMDVVLFINDTSQLSGKTYNIEGNKFGMKPHIWMYWKGASNNSRQQKSYMNGYSLRLEFGEAGNGKLPGKIYLCLPDPEKSFIRGEFAVPIK